MAGQASVGTSLRTDGPGSGAGRTERLAQARLAALDGGVDTDAAAVISNLYRAANAARNHFERTVLSEADLTWTSWVVMWVLWIGDESESRLVAHEAGISKATLTGVARTLHKRGLLRRRQHPSDARRVLLSLSDSGHGLMTALFPRFNRHEALLCGPLSPGERDDTAEALRRVTQQALDLDGVAVPES